MAFFVAFSPGWRKQELEMEELRFSKFDSRGYFLVRG
jgi:hypothetical protein